jgi:Xaa-Pro aminopeptidase
MGRKSMKRVAPPRFPEHPLEEHESRIARMRAAMSEHGLDVLLLARNPNVFYVTGSRFVFLRSDTSRGMAPQTTAILTADDLIYCQRFGPFDTDETSLDTTWANTFEAYDDEMEIANILIDHGVHAGQNIGTEWGHGLCVGINPIKFGILAERIREVTGAHLVDGTTAIKKAMAIKSPLEIERMRIAVAAATSAVEKVFSLVEVGMNSLDISRRASILMLEAGADTVTHSQVLIEDGSPRLGSCDPVDRPIQAGYFHMDLGCTYRRYGSDIHRGIFFGRRPTQLEQKLYECRLRVSDIFDRTIKDGVAVDEVLKAADEYIQSCGCEIPRKGSVIFAGHSIGLETYQGPSLASAASQPDFQDSRGEFILRSGMAFTYEIPIRLSGLETLFNIEDDIVVTEHGVENLSAASPRELRVKL